MTALAIAAQKIIIPRFSAADHAAKVRNAFGAINARGALTLILCGLLGASIAGYVALVAYSFNRGVQLRAGSAAVAQEERLVKNLEMELRAREANFAAEHHAALQDMDTVSSVAYLQAGSVAMR